MFASAEDISQALTLALLIVRLLSATVLPTIPAATPAETLTFSTVTFSTVPANTAEIPPAVNAEEIAIVETSESLTKADLIVPLPLAIPEI